MIQHRRVREIIIATLLLICGLSAGAAPAAPEEPAAVSEQFRTAVGLPFSKRTHVYKTAGDCRIRADVYSAQGTGVRPALLWIHGGALIFGSRESINPFYLGKYLEAGYSVIAVDYRLAPQTKLGAIVEDIEDAYRWVRASGPGLFGIDPDRLGVVGHSAGGYLTLMAGCTLTPRPKALVSFYGYGDITGAWYSRPDPVYRRYPMISEEEARAAVRGPEVSGSPATDRIRFYLYCRQQGLWPSEVTGWNPGKDPQKLYPFCPIRHVTADFPPTLLLHGEKDEDVPCEQSINMAAELKERRVEHELITLPDLGHSFEKDMKNPDIAGSFDRVIAFLGAHLKP